MARAERTVTDATAEAAPPTGGIARWILMAAIGLISGASGFAVPMVLLKSPAGSAAKNGRGGPGEKHDKADHESARHDSPKSPGAKRDPFPNQPAFVPFGEVVVNLAEERLTRYLRVTLTLQVDPAHEETVKKAVERKKTILKNWLIGYLSDKELEEVRGAIGVNKARREIQDQFNHLLFPDGTDLIQEILFEEFTVT